MTGLTFSEAARGLQCDVAVIKRWAKTEQCPVVRDGRKVRIPRSWVDEQLALLRS